MNKMSRNDPCPCGSEKKYKKCCGAKRSTPLKGFTPGIRMKGGVRFDPESDGFIAIVHTWDNIHCLGKPEEWCSPEIFPTEESAMHHYKSYIRPALQQMMETMKNKHSSTTLFHKKLE